MRVHTLIKERTLGGHAKVDALFSSFDLAKRRSYVGFLRAHARAIIPLEQQLFANFDLPRWSPRAALLHEDLKSLESFGDIKFPVCSEMFNHGSRFGVLYVLEGSRFGAAILKGRVASALPQAFLSASAKPDHWPDFLNALECASFRRSSAWLDDVAMGARVAFDFFAESAVTELHLLAREQRAIDAKGQGAL